MFCMSAITEEFLAELFNDFQADGWLHNGLIFNQWKQRHGLTHVSIKDVSHLLKQIEKNENHG